MVDRIRQLLTARQLSPTQFADTIGIGRPVVSHVLSGRNKPSLEVVQKIITAFPELSLPWLLNGNGPMLASAVVATAPLATKEGQIKPVVRRTRRVEPVATTSESTPSQRAKEGLSNPVADSMENRLTQETGPIGSSLSEAPASAIASLHPTAFGSVLNNGKAIRRIVVFYQDGTFSDYQPES